MTIKPPPSFLVFIEKFNFQDDFPLASLPLLGYNVDTPAPSDNISKDYVFKLQFKNHVYFFRAESQFTFDRWAILFCCVPCCVWNFSNKASY